MSEMFKLGSLGDALLRALGRGAADATTRLHAVADAAIFRHGVGNRSVEALRGAVRDDPALLVEMLDQIRFLDPLLRTFIERRAAALKAGGAVIPVGQITSDTHPVGAHGNPQGLAGRSSSGNLTNPARQAQNKPRGLDRMRGATALMRNHILDRLTVNGQPLRLVTAGEALGAAETMAGNAATIMRICTGLKPDVPVGEQLSDGEAEERAALS